MKSFYKSIFIFLITSTLVLGQKSKAISIEQFGAIELEKLVKFL